MSTKGLLAKEKFRVKGGVLGLRFEDWVLAELQLLDGRFNWSRLSTQV